MAVLIGLGRFYDLDNARRWKSHKTAIIAVARGLLVRINAMMKNATSYQT